MEVFLEKLLLQFLWQMRLDEGTSFSSFLFGPALPASALFSEVTFSLTELGGLCERKLIWWISIIISLAHLFCLMENVSAELVELCYHLDFILAPLMSSAFSRLCSARN